MGAAGGPGAVRGGVRGLGGGRARVGGEGGGGMLAGAVGRALRDAACGGIDGIALVYPMLGVAPQPPACVTEAHAPMLTLADIDRYRALYWGDRPPPPATVPLDAARFDGLPPVLALGAEHDPLSDDARVYVERIRAAGGAARFWFGQGLVHGCWRAQGSSPQAARMHEVIGNFLRAPCA